MSKYKIFGNTTQSLKLPAFDPLYNLDLTNNQSIPPEYTFTRNSAGTYVGPDGFIKTANANQPRFDYDPITKEFKGLLIEEQRTNNRINSENASSWGDVGGQTTNVSANVITAPDGNTTADLIYGASGQWTAKDANLSSVSVPNNSYIFSSIFVKRVPNSKYTHISLNISIVGAGDPRVVFNLDTGEVTFNNLSIGYSEKLVNGWYRLVAGFQNTTGSTQSYVTNNVRIFGLNTSTGEQGSGLGTGSTTDGIYVWGWQVEVGTGSFPTSYIPTAGSTVTRLADQLVLNQSLSTSGTFFIEARPTMGTTLVADNGTNAYYISPTLNTTTKNTLYYNTNRVLTMSSSNTSTLGQSTNYQSTSGLNRVSLGFDRLNNTNYINGHIKNFKYYDSPVTEDNLRSLTGSNKNISRVADGLIVTNGLVLNLDAGNRNSYPGSGTTWTDLSGNGNNGTLVNGPTYSSANGGSIVFNPTTVTSHHVNCGNILNFTTENFSFNIFFYLTSTTTNSAGQGPILFYRGPYLQDGYYIQINQANPCGVSFITNQPGAFQTTSSSSLLIVGTWNCVSVVRSGSSVKTYINGIDATAFAGTHINPATSSANFLLATYAVSIYANIRIGSFQAYNRALSPTEVQQNFNALRGRFGI